MIKKIGLINRVSRKLKAGHGTIDYTFVPCRRKQPLNKNFLATILYMALGISLLLAASQAGTGLAEAADVDAGFQQETLLQRRAALESRLVECGPGPYAGQYSESLTRCAQGDIVMFSGLACLAARLAGDDKTADARCRDVALSQDGSGRFWRGASRIGDEEPRSFSRDMARGVLAYFLAEGAVNPDPEARLRARDSARRWIGWMQGEGQGRLCAPVGPDACYLAQGIRSLMYYVFKKLDVLPPRSTPLGWRIHLASHHPYYGLPLEIGFSPRGNSLNLKAISLLLLRVATPPFDKSGNRFLDEVSEALGMRDPGNAFFRFLDEGATPWVIRRTLERCRVERPDPEHDRRDFQWQRYSEDGVWTHTDGHDCVFMLNLILSYQNGRLAW